MKTVPWLETAKKFLGTREIPGVQNSATIMGWAKRMGGWITNFYRNDEIPWCGLFVGNCLREHGLSLPKNPLSAMAYNDWGVPLTKGTPGAIMVFKRKGGGHVAFYVSEDKDFYHILGGNQSNMVNVAKKEKNQWVGIRWPKEVPVPTTGPVYAEFKGPLSVNEA